MNGSSAKFHAPEIAGKNPETMVFVEILRTVVSEIKINKITIIPVIAETSGYSLITIRNTILQVCTYILSKNLRSLRILQYTSNMMSFESTTIVQFPFKELSLFSPSELEDCDITFSSLIFVKFNVPSG